MLRREGVTQLPSFDHDWAHVNKALAPIDYHRDIVGVRRDFKGDVVRRSSGLLRTPSASTPPESELEVSGIPNVTHSQVAMPSCGHVQPNLNKGTKANILATPPSSNESEIEVTGSPILTPTGANVPSCMGVAQYNMHEDSRNDSGSEIEVIGDPILTPTGAIVLSRKRTKQNLHDQRTLKHSRHHIPSLDNSPSPSWPSVGHPVSPLSYESPPLYIPSVSPYGPSTTNSRGRYSSPSPSYAGSSAFSSPSPAIRHSESPSSKSSRPRKGVAWHHGMYCIEFADGLEQMAQSGLSQEDAFHKAFPGRVWTRRTFQDNKKQWLQIASTTARANAISAGRTREGLWRLFSRQNPIVKTNKKQ